MEIAANNFSRKHYDNPEINYLYYANMENVHKGRHLRLYLNDFFLHPLLGKCAVDIFQQTLVELWEIANKILEHFG